MNEDQLGTFRQAVLVINYTDFGITVTLQTLFFLKFLRHRCIDSGAYFILLAYLVVSTSRLFLDSTDFYSGLDYIQPVAGSIIWIMLLFFIYEMAFVKDTLEC